MCLEVQDSRGWVATHSAERTEEISGTNDWKYVEGIYETLPDAVSVMLIARRNGSDGPLHGKAYFKEVRLEKFVPNSDSIHVPYLSVNASKSNDGDRIYLMVVNKNMDKGVAAVIDIKDFIQSDIINVWVMNGPGVDATNERKHDNVKVTHHELNVKGNSFEFTFEPHSLTAIEIQRERI